MLHQPLAISWQRCTPLNPFLIAWCDQAARTALGITRWPRIAADWLGGTAYARRFTELLTTPPQERVGPSAGRAAQDDFIRQKLRSENLYPLTWRI